MRPRTRTAPLWPVLLLWLSSCGSGSSQIFLSWPEIAAEAEVAILAVEQEGVLEAWAASPQAATVVPESPGPLSALLYERGLDALPFGVGRIQPDPSGTPILEAAVPSLILSASSPWASFRQIGAEDLPISVKKLKIRVPEPPPLDCGQFEQERFPLEFAGNSSSWALSPAPGQALIGVESHTYLVDSDRQVLELVSVPGELRLTAATKDPAGDFWFGSIRGVLYRGIIDEARGEIGLTEEASLESLQELIRLGTVSSTSGQEVVVLTRQGQLETYSELDGWTERYVFDANLAGNRPKGGIVSSSTTEIFAGWISDQTIVRYSMGGRLVEYAVTSLGGGITALGLLPSGAPIAGTDAFGDLFRWSGSGWVSMGPEATLAKSVLSMAVFGENLALGGLGGKLRVYQEEADVFCPVTGLPSHVRELVALDRELLVALIEPSADSSWELVFLTPR